MKKLLSTCCILLIVVTTFGQSHSQGTLSFQADYSFGAHLAVSESKFNNTSLGKDSSGVATSMFQLSTQYSIFDFLSAGAYFGLGSYLEDPENAESQGNSILSFGADVRINIVNKYDFNWYIGSKLGFSALEINRKPFGVFVETRANYSSLELGVFSGINYYFNDYIGINFDLGYLQHNFLMNEYYINENPQNISNFENRLRTQGLVLNIGLALKFN